MFPGGISLPAHWLRIIMSATVAGTVALIVPLTALAAEVRSGDTVTIGPDEVITDDVYVFGNNLVIQGTVNGDVIAAGSSVTVAGHVTGSVAAAGSTLTISGPVDGTARLAGNLVTVSAPVGGDVLMAGSMLTLNSPGRVGRDVLVGGNAVNVQAPVGRNLKAGATTLTVGSTVGGAVDASVTDLVLGNAAVVKGPVSYVSGHDAAVAPGARIESTIQRTPPAVKAANPWEVGGIDTLALLRGFVGLAALGVLLVLAFPRAAATTTAAVQHQWAASLGLGFALLVGIPVLAIVVFALGLAVGGWWIGLMLLGLYAVLTVVAYLAFAEWVGLTAVRLGKWSAHPVWAMLLGLLILGMLSLIPVAGTLVALAATVFGIGGLSLSAWQTYRRTVSPDHTTMAGQPPTPLQVAA
jgi:cytoskeletal protein CcmA (bactofilin family)